MLKNFGLWKTKSFKYLQEEEEKRRVKYTKKKKTTAISNFYLNTNQNLKLKACLKSHNQTL